MLHREMFPKGVFQMPSIHEIRENETDNSISLSAPIPNIWEREKEFIKDFYDFSGLTDEEAKMIEDWLNHLSSFPPNKQASEWKMAQREIRKKLKVLVQKDRNMWIILS